MITLTDVEGFANSFQAFQILRVQATDGDRCIVHINGGGQVIVRESRAEVVEKIQESDSFWPPLGAEDQP